MMKKLIALLLTLALMLTLFAGCQNDANDPTETDPVEVDDGICETAQECVDNITVGWNLGCSLSAFATESIDAWGVMAYFMTPDKLYSRSEVYSFDPETRTAEISWYIGKDGGALQLYEGALVDYIGIELWNFALGASDFLTYSLDDLRYVTADGEVVLSDALGEKTTDMGDGTGGGQVADLDEPLAADIQEIHAKVTFIEQTTGGSTPEGVAAAEMSWGNPVTTQKMIDKVAERGFNMIRVQVSWVNHMDEEGNIDPLWLERVAEVVDYCMNANVYCLLNTSGAGWLTADPETFPEQSKIYKRLWEQIAERFAGYGELLLFESCNEVLTSDQQWWNPPAESYDVMNELYQIFVDTVRAGGGYNETRNLVLNPYAATYDYHMNQGFKLPKDTVEGHLMAQVHCYDPNTFCFNETNLGSTNFANEWGTDAEKRKLDEIMKNIKKRFIDELGIPVIIGEFGTVNRVVEEERAEYVGYYAKAAEENGIKVIIFDDGGDFTVFDRTTLIWPYPQIIDALFNKYAPPHDVEDEYVELDESVEGWSVVAYFSGTDSSYNRSDAFVFDPETNTAQVVWKLGKDGVMSTADNAGIDGLGVELWNFDKGNSDFAKYVVEEIVLVTKKGERIVEDGLGDYTTDMSGGTGGGTVVDFMDNPAVSSVSEIRVKVKLLGSYVKDVGPVKEALEVPDFVPAPSYVSNPLSGWSAKIYMSATDHSYSTSVATEFNASNKTAKIVWILGQDGGVYTAAANAGIDILGVDIWNFSLDEKTTINYWIKDLKYYTTKDIIDVTPTQSAYKTDMSGGTGGGTVADLNGPPLANIVAIYMEVQIDGKATGGGSDDGPTAGTTVSNVSSLPSVSVTSNPIENYQTVLYLATQQTGFNRSDPAVSFDADTMTAEVLWDLNKGRADGFVTAGKGEGLAVIGAQIYNFAEKPSGVKYTVESLKYYMKDGGGYKEYTVSLPQKNFSTSLKGSGANGGPIVSLASPPPVGDVAAIYAKIKLDLSNVGGVDPDAPVRPEHPTEGLPTVTPATDPLVTGMRMYLATKETGYNVCPWANYDAVTKTADALWLMNDESVTAGNDEKLGIVGLELANYAEYPSNVKVRIDEMKYYTASGDTCVAHDLSFPAGELIYDLSGGMEGKAIVDFGENGPRIKDVVAIYIKTSLVVDGTDEPDVPVTPVELPTVTAPTDPTSACFKVYMGDPYCAPAAFVNFDNTTKTGEYLWDFSDGSTAANAEKTMNVLSVQAADFQTGAGELKLKVDTIKYYKAIEGGYQEVEVPVADTVHTFNLAGNGSIANVATLTGAPVIGDVAAVYVKVSLVEEGTEVPGGEPLPTVTAPANPTTFCFKPYMGDPYCAPAAFVNFDKVAKTGEYLWDFSDGSTAASAAKTMNVLSLQLADFQTGTGEAKVKVETIKYYKAVDGGYEAVEVPVSDEIYTFNLAGNGSIANVVTLSDAPVIGDVAAVYVKLALVVEEEPGTPEVTPVPLPTVTAPADPTTFCFKPYMGDPYCAPAAFVNLDKTTGTGEYLWDFSDGTTASHAARTMNVLSLQLADFQTGTGEAKVKVDSIKYYKAIEGGYEEVEVPVADTVHTFDLSGSGTAHNVATLENAPVIGDVAAVYMKVSLVEDKPQTEQEWNADGTLKILTVGNSFSDDMMEHVYQIAKAAGVQNVELGNLYYSGCSLNQHYDFWSNNKAVYLYRTNTNGTWSTQSEATFEEAFKTTDWDYISFQESAQAVQSNASCYTNLPALIGMAKDRCPGAKIVWHMPWANPHANYGQNIDAMYADLCKAVSTQISGVENIRMVIPTGTAIQNMRTSYANSQDVLMRDGWHLSNDVGRYVAGLTLVKQLTGLSIDNVTWTPATLEGNLREVCIEAANNAVANPLSVTESAYKPLPVVEAPADPSTSCFKLYMGDPYCAPSAFVNFDNATGTGEYLWDFSDGSVAANAEKTMNVLSVQAADFQTGAGELKLKVDTIKYYKTIEGGGYEEVEVPVTDTVYTFNLAGSGTAHNVATLENAPVIGDVAAVYVKISLVEDKPQEPEVTPVPLPTVTAPADPTTFCFKPYMGDPYCAPAAFVNFDKTTGTGEYLWDFSDGTTASHAARTMNVLSLQLADFQTGTGEAKVKVDSIKYYKAIEGGYEEVEVPVADTVHTFDLSGSGTAHNVATLENAPVIGDVAAVYMKISLVEDKPQEPEVTPVPLPTVTAPANPTTACFKMYMGDPYCAPAAFINFDNAAKTGEYLWDFSDGSVAANAEKTMNVLSVQAADFQTGAGELKLKVDTIKYYKAIEGGYEEVEVPVADTVYTFNLAGSGTAHNVATLENAPVIGDVAAVYMKVSLVVEEAPEKPEVTPVQLPTVTAPATPTTFCMKAYMGDPYCAPAAFVNLDKTTGTGEYLWDFSDGTTASHAARTMNVLSLQLADFQTGTGEVKVKVESVKYYKAIEGGYEEVEVPVTGDVYTFDLSGSGTAHNVVTLQNAPVIGDVAAVYMKVSVVVENAAEEAAAQQIGEETLEKAPAETVAVMPEDPQSAKDPEKKETV